MALRGPAKLGWRVLSPKNSGDAVVGRGDAFDGAEAVEKFSAFDIKPEVIILDHRMPNKDGMQTMKEILELDSGAKIVFISADANVREQAMNNGAASFGLKPVTIRHMLDLVESAVSD